MNLGDALIEMSRDRKSWRERLQWVRDRFVDPTFTPSAGDLATLAVYLRFLATGEVRCVEDGRHFRPNHHAEAALQIETAMERLFNADTAWILRRICPYLPSSSNAFRRAEPLTRIRDIAHRNDIPHEVKLDIKTRLQNKLHRCAGPEDLRTSADILARITAPDASYSPEFIAEYRIFHEELQEFFNASALDKRLQVLANSLGSVSAAAVRAFLDAKVQEAPPGDERRLEVLERLTALRQLLAEEIGRADPPLRAQLRRADIALEDHAFARLSDLANSLGDPLLADAWPVFLRALAMVLVNLPLGQIEPEECGALHSEVVEWSHGFSMENRFHLLRLLATLSRGRRLAENHIDRINALFSARAETLGHALGVTEHAIKVFSEGDLRGHVIFQLSRLVDLGLAATRALLQLPPWEAIVPGRATGRLVRLSDLTQAERTDQPLLVLLARADGDAEVPTAVRGILVGHPIPHLSHLGVRARQARVPFAAAVRPQQLGDYEPFVGKMVCLSVTPEGPSLREAEPAKDKALAVPEAARFTARVPKAVLVDAPRALPLVEAMAASCGAKAAGARQLLELAAQSAGLFRVPQGMVIPFGVMERCLEVNPGVRQEYLALRARVPEATSAELGPLLDRLRRLVGGLSVLPEISKAIAAGFPADTLLAIRSSANGEDLESLAGAGLYESVIGVRPADAPRAIAHVWASLWTRRATLSRSQGNIAHECIHMAVLLQELVSPDLSFIMHTVHPLTADHGTALVELAVGLGETLASAALPGTPYRMACDRASGDSCLCACANFGMALMPGAVAGESVRRRLDYSRVPLSADPEVAPRLGRRLAQAAAAIERAFGAPQDVEGVYAGNEIHLVQARPQQGLDVACL
jgi:phosphoglucan,water dikinase